MTSKQEKKTLGFNYNKIPVGYYDKIYQSRSGAQSKWHHLKFQTVVSHMGNYKNHLDYGCGSGTFVSLLDSDKNSTGIDIAQAQLDYAMEHKTSQNHQFKLMSSSESLPFKDKSFDLVTMIDVIEHIEKQDIDFLIKELDRVLEPGGKFIIVTPNYKSLWPMLEFLVGALSPVTYQDQHVSKYNKKKIKALLESYNFKIQTMRSIQGISPFLAGISWNISDFCGWIENRFINLYGFMLIGIGEKQ